MKAILIDKDGFKREIAVQYPPPKVYSIAVHDNVTNYYQSDAPVPTDVGYSRRDFRLYEILKNESNMDSVALYKEELSLSEYASQHAGSAEYYKQLQQYQNMKAAYEAKQQQIMNEQAYSKAASHQVKLQQQMLLQQMQNTQWAYATQNTHWQDTTDPQLPQPTHIELTPTAPAVPEKKIPEPDPPKRRLMVKER